jgi:glycosyltransferase involved in cell wall biosynthesis
MKLKNPLVSIIIPCFNYEQYIEHCIESALAQTYKNIEIIVIDNGSTDASYAKMQKFSKNKNFKILKFEENNPPGQQGSFHMGDAIRASKGEYISLLYADDWYLPEKIEKQVRLFELSSQSVGLVYCHGYVYHQETGRLEDWKMQSVRGYVFKHSMLHGDIVIPISPLIKRFCYELIGLDNIWTGTEYDCLMLGKYVDFDFVDEHLVTMRSHKENDAKNSFSVYERVKKFHNIGLLNEDAISRAGYLVNKRVSMNHYIYGLTFISSMYLKNGREAIFMSIKLYPFHIFKVKVFVGLLLTFLPQSLTKIILTTTGKLSPSISNCDW